MIGHGGSSAGSNFVDPAIPIPSHCASIVVTSTLGVKKNLLVELYDSLWPLHSYKNRQKVL